MSICLRACRVVVLLTVLVLGCENVTVVRGTITNEANGMPLDSVRVSILIGGTVSERPPALSDSLGKFAVGSGLYGCGCSCPDVYIIVERDGFIADTLKVRAGDNSDYGISMKASK